MDKYDDWSEEEKEAFRVMLYLSGMSKEDIEDTLILWKKGHSIEFTILPSDYKDKSPEVKKDDLHSAKISWFEVPDLAVIDEKTREVVFGDWVEVLEAFRKGEL